MTPNKVTVHHKTLEVAKYILCDVCTERCDAKEKFPKKTCFILRQK